MTLAEKVLSRASGEEEIEPGDYLTAKIDVAMAHEGLAGVASKLGDTDFETVWNPSKIVTLLDHWIPAHTERNATIHMIARDFIEEQGLENFYGIREGICHQVMVEKGHVLPGSLIVGTDSHSTTYGALGAAGTGIGFSEMAYVFAKGELWFRVPESINIKIDGILPSGTTSKDVMLDIAGKLGTDIATYKSIEYTGSTLEDMSIESRMVLSNMAVELGAKFGFCPIDEKAIKYTEEKTEEKVEKINSDQNYEETYKFDVGNLKPKIACPHSVDNVKDVSELEGELEFDQYFLGSCTNGRFEDMRMAAEILEGNEVEKRTIVTPASRSVYKKMVDSGIIDTFINSGCVITNPTCGACIGGSMGVLAGGEKCLATTNRNFKGRMGSENSEVYLASPQTVAASAIEGSLKDPGGV